MAATKLDPIVEGIIIDAVRTGVPYTHACELAGIAYQTFLNWQEKGEAGEPKYVDFLERLKRAKGEAVEARIKRIEAAGKQGSWQADAWWLERQLPSEFGKREAVELTGKDGGAVKVDSTLRGSLSDVEAILNDPDATAAAATLTAKLTNCAAQSASSGGISPPEQD